MNRNPKTDRYGDGDVPEIDTKPYSNGHTPEIDTERYHNRHAPEIDTERYRNSAQVEPLPESTRERRDGPGGN